jgi:uncharacterized phiE125 gp8 family phage protein
MNLLTVDRAALPAALLSLAKDHCRVRHTRDDALIRQYIAQAIDAIERRCSINLNPATFALDLYVRAWPLCATAPAYVVPPMRWPLPVNNVLSFTLVDTNDVDQSAPYTIEQADIGGSAAAYLVGPNIPAAGWKMTLDVGIDVPAAPALPAMAPAVQAAVLRLVGGYYETRESAVALVIDEFIPELAPVWRPSA